MPSRQGGRGHRGFKDEHRLPGVLLWPLDHTGWTDPADNHGRASPRPPTGARAPGRPEHRSGALIQAEGRGGAHSPTSLSPALVRWGPPAVQLAWGSVGRGAGPRALLWGTGRVSIASTGPGLEQPRYQACQRCWKPHRPRSVRTSRNLHSITGGLAGCRRLLPDGSQVKATQVLGTQRHRLTERHPG